MDRVVQVLLSLDTGAAIIEALYHFSISRLAITPFQTSPSFTAWIFRFQLTHYLNGRWFRSSPQGIIGYLGLIITINYNLYYFKYFNK